MQTNAATAEKATDTLGPSLVDGLARSFTIGTDADGNDHHYYRAADAVVVYDGRTLDHVEYLDGHDVGAWVDYVADRRGWDHVRDLGRQLVTYVDAGAEVRR